MESPVEKLADVEFHQDGQETQENKLYLPAQWGSIFCNLERDKHVEVVLFFCVNRFVLFCFVYYLRIFIAMIKHNTKMQFGEERVYFSL